MFQDLPGSRTISFYSKLVINLLTTVNAVIEPRVSFLFPIGNDFRLDITRSFPQYELPQQISRPHDQVCGEIRGDRNAIFRIGNIQNAMINFTLIKKTIWCGTHTSFDYPAF